MSLYSQIEVLFLMMVVGFYSRKRNIINEQINKGLSSFLINITLPLLILDSFTLQYDEAMMGNVLITLLVSFVAFIFTIVCGQILSIPLNGSRKDVIKFIVTFSNCGFMGFPVIESIFGKEGVMYASIFNVIFTIFIWSYGVLLYSDKKEEIDWVRILMNPGIIAVIIGIIVMFIHISIPVVISDTIKMVGGMTTPLSMIITGNMMANVSFKKGIKDWTVYYAVVIRLLFIPIIIYFFTIPFTDYYVPIQTVIIAEAMPVAATASIFAQNFNKEQDFSALSVFFSTLISIVTIPLILKIIT